jgi:hypothetical protein
MTIHIHRVQATDDNAIEFISEPDDLVRRIVRAWHNSVIPNCFKNKGGFIKAVHRNRKTLSSKARDGIGMFFTSGNYLFSTKAEGRKETLYFKAWAAGVGSWPQRTKPVKHPTCTESEEDPILVQRDSRRSPLP